MPINDTIDYYPFGMQMPGRVMASGAYRYGFNSQEQDNDIYGNGNSYTAEFWQYDSRLGRRWNVDPVVKHWISDYATFNNSPMAFKDLKGDNATSYVDEDGKLMGTTLDGNPQIVQVSDKDKPLFEKVLENTESNKRNDAEWNKSWTDYLTRDGAGKVVEDADELRNFEWSAGGRPDEYNDLSFGDAVWWYRLGEGNPLIVDLENIDLSNVSVSDFKGKKRMAVNLEKGKYANNREQGKIYGSITLELINKNTVMAYPDYYNFEIHGKGDIVRDIATMGALMFHGGGKPYPIIFTGTKKIRP